MARNNRVTLGLFMAAAFAAFGVMPDQARAADIEWVVNENSVVAPNFNNVDHNFYEYDSVNDIDTFPIATADDNVFFHDSVYLHEAGVSVDPLKVVSVNTGNVNVNNMVVTGDSYVFNNGQIVGGGNLTVSGDGVTFNSNVYFRSGTATIGDVYSSGSVNAYMTGDIDFSKINIVNSSNLHVTSSQTGNIIELEGTGTLTKTGSGTFYLTTRNSDGYVGNIDISAGSFSLINNASLANATVNVGTGTLLISNLASGVASATLGKLAGTGEVEIGGKTLILKSTDDNFQGSLKSTALGGVEFTTGNSSLNTAQNDLWGKVHVNGGNLYLKNNAAIQNAKEVVVDSGTFSIAGVTADNIQVDDFSGAGGTVALGEKTLVIGDGSANSSSYSGVITSHSTRDLDGGIEVDVGSTSTLTLKNANTYEGDTVLTSGKLKLDESGSIKESNLVDIGSGTTLELARTDSVKSEIQAVNGAAGSTIDIGNNNTLSLTGNDTTMGTYSGVIQGLGNLELNADSKVFTLNSEADHRGTTNIASGTLKLGAAGDINNGDNALHIGTSGKLDVSSKSAYALNSYLVGSGTTSEIALGSDPTSTFNFNNGGALGKVSGSGKVIVSGTDTSSLAVYNIEATDTTVNSGNLTVKGTVNNTAHVNGGSLTLESTGKIIGTTTVAAGVVNSAGTTGTVAVTGGAFTSSGATGAVTVNGISTDKGIFTSTGTTGAVTVGNHGVFNASGIVDSVTLNSGSVLASGSALSVTNDLVANGSAMNLTAGGQNNGILEVGGKVDIANSAIALTNGVSGVYDVFTLTDSSKSLLFKGQNNTVTADGKNVLVYQDTNTDGEKVLRVFLSKDGQYFQTWEGGANGNKWDHDTSKNWSNIIAYDDDGKTHDITATDPDVWRGDLENTRGWVAIFDSTGNNNTPVEVVGTQYVDTMQFRDKDYTINGSNNNSALSLAPAIDGDNAAISANNSTATINVNLTGNTGLDVDGSGTVILAGSNSYTGKTVLMNSVTLQLNKAASAGGDDIVFSDGSSAASGAALVLNFNNETLNNRITGGTASSTNSVVVSSGKTVTLNNTSGTDSDYHGDTIVENGATLIANGTGSLSKNSYYELGDKTTLRVNGSQDIAGLEASTTSTLDIGGALNVYNAQDNEYAGALKGQGTFVAQGTGDFAIYNLNTTNFTGTFKNSDNGGDLELYGASGQDLDINIGSLDSDHDGKFIIAAAGSGNNITLNEKNSGHNIFNGEIQINQGTFRLDDDAEALLDDATLILSSTAASMVVNSPDAEIGDLTLTDNARLVFQQNALTGKSSQLSVDHLNVDSAVVTVDTTDFDRNIDNQNLFDLDKGIRDYFLEANSIEENSNKQVTIQDSNGGLLNNQRTHILTRDGVENGIATIKTDSGLEDGSTDATLGLYYSQQLTQIQSLGNTANVVLSSTGASNSSAYSWRSSGVVKPGDDGYETMNAKLTGEGGFDFTGNKPIIIANGTNDYRGTTYINMDSMWQGVYMGADGVLGNTSLLDINRGVVYMNEKTVEVGAVSGTSGGEINFDSTTAAGILNIATKAGTPAEATFDGRVTGYGNINKSGSGSQYFTSANNSLTGAVTMNGGTLGWAGRLASAGYGSTATALTVNGGNFVQLGSTIAGSVVVSGADARLSGYGAIQGNLNVNNGGIYLVTTESGSLDTTTVSGKTTFGADSDFVFSTEAKSWLVAHPGYSPMDVLSSYGGLDLTASKWGPDGRIDIDLGILGTATIQQDGNSLVYEGIDAPVDPKNTIKTSWAQDGINVNDLLDRSNIGDVVVDTVTKYLWGSPSPVATNKVVNARYANAEFMGQVFQDSLRYSRKEALSVFNYDSGYTATLPVQAALDTVKSFVGQGIKNRVNNLRAARTILATPAYGFGYGGYMQPTGAYASTIVQDTFGYNAPGYLGSTYYDPYTGTAQNVNAAPGYGYAPQASYGYAPARFAPPSSSSLNLWAGGIGSWNKQKTSSGGIGGYTYDAGGLMIGLDRVSGPVVLGAALGYSNGKLKDKEAISSDSKIHAYSASLYADYNHESGINGMLFGGYTWFDNKINRTVAGYRDTDGVLTSDYGRENHKYHSQAWHIGANVSYDWIPTNRLTVSPSLGVEYYDARGKSHRRDLVRNSGVTISDKVSSIHGRSLTAPLDVNVTYDVIKTWDTKLALMGNVGYSYEFHNKGPKGSLYWMDVEDSPTVNIYGRKPGRSGFNLGAGARFQKKCLSFDVKYDYAHRKDNTSHRVAANVGWEF